MTTQQSFFSRPSSRSNGQDDRLATIRRLYFYLVALISSTVALIALNGLTNALAIAWLGGNALYTINSPLFLRSALAQSAGLLVVSVPIFLVHWTLIRRRLDQPGERSAGLRKFFLYSASAVALGYLLVRGSDLLSGIAKLAFGADLAQSSIWPGEWLHLSLMIAASGALLWYWQRVARADGDYGYEAGMAATWRRIFFAGATLVGLAMLVIGSAGLFSTLIEATLDNFATSVGNAWFATEMGNATALFLIGAVTARWAWMTWQSVTAINPQEETSTVKRVFVYVATLGAAIATLLPATFILRDLLLWFFNGRTESWVELTSGLSLALGFLPAAVTLWVALRDYISHLEALPAIDAADQRDADTIRRIYYYVVAATGLVLVWLGSVRVMQVAIDQLITSRAIETAGFWQLPLATGLSLLMVGVPVWALHWRTVQRVARQQDDAGAAERSSLPRRIFLYGVSFVGAILILSYLAQVIYRGLLYVLGGTVAENFSGLLAEDIARSVIAIVLWAVHLKALRDDGALGAEGVPFVGGGGDNSRRRDQIERRIDNLEYELVRLRTTLHEIDAEEEAILAQRASLAVEADEIPEAPALVAVPDAPVAPPTKSAKANGAAGNGTSANGTPANGTPANGAPASGNQSRTPSVQLFATQPVDLFVMQPVAASAPDMTTAAMAAAPVAAVMDLPDSPMPIQTMPEMASETPLAPEPAPVKKPRTKRPPALG